jgi:hypothetical protein
MRNKVLWDMTPCSLVEKCSEGTLVFTSKYVLPLRLGPEYRSRCWHSSTNIYGVMSQKKKNLTSSK